HSDKTMDGGLRARKYDVSGNGSTKSGSRQRAVVAEQVRRNRMKYLYTKLESLLPTRPLAKLDRCGLLEEGNNYIRKLQDDVYQLKREREHLRALKQHCGKTEEENGREDIRVSVKIHGIEAVITVCSIRRPRCVWRMIEEVERHGLEVDMSQLSTSEFFVYLYFHAKSTQDVKDYDPVKSQTSLKK
ncbi:hypothetical protein KI387_007520, partial [Taxus chinensis]